MINASKFWQNQREIVRINDMPDVLSNGFIVDFHCPGAWEEFEPSRTVETFSHNFTDCTKELYKVSQGRELDDVFLEDTLYLYRYETVSGSHAYLQKQYAEYFIRRYPGCKFYYEDINKPVAVLLGNEIVGGIAPVSAGIKYIEK